MKKINYCISGDIVINKCKYIALTTGQSGLHRSAHIWIRSSRCWFTWWLLLKWKPYHFYLKTHFALDLESTIINFYFTRRLSWTFFWLHSMPKDSMPMMYTNLFYCRITLWILSEWHNLHKLLFVLTIAICFRPTLISQTSSKKLTIKPLSLLTTSFHWSMMYTEHLSRLRTILSRLNL